MESGREWQGAQSGQCGVELVLPGPVLGQVQGEAAGFAFDRGVPALRFLRGLPTLIEKVVSKVRSLD